MVQPRLTPGEFRALLAEVLGSTDPLAEAVALVAALRAEALGRVQALEAGKPGAGAFDGIGSLEAPDFDRILPTAPISLSVVVPRQAVLVGGKAVSTESAVVLVPRPGDIISEDLGGVESAPGGFLPRVYATGGPFESAPSVLRIRGGISSPLLAGTDYTVNLSAGTVTTVGSSTNLTGGDRLRIVARWAGTWSASVSVGPDGVPLARRGFGSDPRKTWPEVRGPLVEETLLGAVRSLSSATAGINVDRIDLRAKDYSGTSVLGLLEGDLAHRHRPDVPLDGGRVSLFDLGDLSDGFRTESGPVLVAEDRPVGFVLGPFRYDDNGDLVARRERVDLGAFSREMAFRYDDDGDIVPKEIP